MAKNTIREKISGKELGAILGIGERWVRDLEKQGVIVKLGYGEYDLAASVQGYIRFKVESEVRAAKPSALDDRTDYERERARKLKLHNDQTENMLVPVADATAAVEGIVGYTRASLSAMPARLSDDVVLRRRVETEIDVILNGLADRLATAGRALATGGDTREADEAVDA